MIMDEHINFMRDVVALARKHGVNHLTVHFDLSSTRRFLAGFHGNTRVEASWREGRHGDPKEITFTSTDRTSFSEVPKVGE